jgi:ABC-type thiamine transport system substrate-binding protein
MTRFAFATGDGANRVAVVAPRNAAAGQPFLAAMLQKLGASGAADALERVASTRPLNRVLEES